ncbi:DUF4114 domain-containing protein [Palleronia sp. LCG004]|uniref:DUF4114 domain-containing protein n=1 Tax=Palleronia sp. LCG004 TaxID=3079304 RepID=UPI0029434F55|nr:DUF4114 domain-containing protein [Palleronia sp. LCG004]WOI57445.1 DUF4114 domain-containing protein [Palleronia sp. LCG004]
MTFDFEEAAYRNTIGVYKVDAETGEFRDIALVWANASLEGSGGTLVSGISSVEYTVEAGDKIGFFLVANGYANAGLDEMTENGEFYFVDGRKDAATVESTGTKLMHRSADGQVRLVYGDIYHTAAFGDRAKLNSDGIEHTVGLKNDDGGSFQIGFEDLSHGGDRDFDDAIFTVDIGGASIAVLNAHYDQTLQTATEGMYISETSRMRADPGNDRLAGQEGSDTIEGMQGHDLLAGGDAGAEWSFVDGRWIFDPTQLHGDGTYTPDEHDDHLMGGTGDDVLLGGRGNDTLDGGAGNDTLNAGRGRDAADGGDGNDLINLEDGDDLGLGGAGDDVINAGAGNDVAEGGSGTDQLRGADGDDRLSGDDGADELHGGADNDLLDGGTGNDKLFGGADDDTLSGGTGDDHCSGGQGADDIAGGAGCDVLMGGTGSDTLDGGSDADKIVGGAGSDRLSGGNGNDHLWGGEWHADGAADTFVFERGSGRDMIHDFEVGVDRIDLSSWNLGTEDLADCIVDKNWSTEIVLSGADDTLILKAVAGTELGMEDFIL